MNMKNPMEVKIDKYTYWTNNTTGDGANSTVYKGISTQHSGERIKDQMPVIIKKVK